MKIVGFTGKLGSGKSTAAQMLAAKFQHASVLPLASKIKEIAAIMGWNGVKDEKGRRLLQLLGTECGRECIGENVWVDLWLENALAFDKSLENPLSWPPIAKNSIAVICDDVRFDNEAAALRASGGIIVQVIGREGEASAEQKQHASEAGVRTDLIDYTINNAETLDKLVVAINTLYKELTNEANCS